MGPWLLAFLWVAFVSNASVAALLAASSARRGVARALAWLVVVALVAATAVPVGQALWLRHQLGALGIPWGLDVAVGAAHLLLLVGYVRAARRGALPGSVASWSVSAALTLALTLLVAQQLELRARLFAADLRFEAGRAAWRLLEPAPPPERDAWPMYRRVGEAWFADEASIERLDAVSEDRERLAKGEDLDFEYPARRARLDALAKDLVQVHVAASFPGCDFGGRHAALSKADATALGEGTLVALRFADALYVDACARLAANDVKGALEDLLTLGRMNRHALASPVMIDLMVGTVMAERSLELCARLLERVELDPDQLQTIGSALPRDLTRAAGRALEMEQAWVGSALSVVASGDGLAAGLDLSLSRLESALYLIFLLEHDMRGYQTSMDELHALAGGDLEALVAEAELDDTTLRERYAARGMVSVLAVGMFARHLLHTRRIDARLALAREALAEFARDPDAARAKGRWIDPDPAWGDDPPAFALAPGS